LTERERRALRRNRPGDRTEGPAADRASPQDIAAGPGRLARLPAVVVQGRAMSTVTTE
jgi:hypothetical protein